MKQYVVEVGDNIYNYDGINGHAVIGKEHAKTYDTYESAKEFAEKIGGKVRRK